jgi:hypothetical protein
LATLNPSCPPEFAAIISKIRGMLLSIDIVCFATYTLDNSQRQQYKSESYRCLALASSAQFEAVQAAISADQCASL